MNLETTKIAENGRLGAFGSDSCCEVFENQTGNSKSDPGAVQEDWLYIQKKDHS